MLSNIKEENLSLELSYVCGLQELENNDFDWITVSPGMLSGHMECATGTCNYKPHDEGIDLPRIQNAFDLKDPLSIKLKYGSLRKEA